MAAIDYGVISFIDKKYAINEECVRVSQGADGFIRILVDGRDVSFIEFSRTHALITGSAAGEGKVILFYEETIFSKKKKKVFYWEERGIQFKTKVVGVETFITTFRFNDRLFKVVQGYGVSLNPCIGDKEILKKIIKEAEKEQKNEK